MPILDANTPQTFIPYLIRGVGIFGGFGSPESVEYGGIGSIYSDLLTGDIYSKTTSFFVNTGWTLLGGSGGSGTVTSIGLTGNSIFDITSDTTNPITNNGTFDIDFISQSQNLFFASPSGSAGLPSFRGIVAADIAGLAIASPPSASIQYNNGSNALAGINTFTFDDLTTTLLLGASAVDSGQLDFRDVNGARFRFRTNNPVNQEWILPDALPSGAQGILATPSGANVTLSYSTFGTANVNPTSGIIPYNNAGSFADSPLQRIDATQMNLNGAADMTLGVSSVAANAALQLKAQGTGVIRVFGGSIGRSLQMQDGNIATSDYNYGSTGFPKYTLAGTTSANVQGSWNSTTSYLLLNSSHAIGFSSASNIGGSTSGGDVELRRHNVSSVVALRIANNGGNQQRLFLGGSAQTSLGQFHTNALDNATVNIYGETPSGGTTDLMQLVVSGVGAFNVGAKGKIKGAANLVTRFSSRGNLSSDVSSVGNSGASATNLNTYSLTANSIAETASGLTGEAFGTFEDFATENKQIQLVLGSTVIYDSGSALFNLSSWHITFTILRTASNAQKCMVRCVTDDALGILPYQYTTASEDWTTGLTLKTVGTGTASSQIFGEGMFVDSLLIN